MEWLLPDLSDSITSDLLRPKVNYCAKWEQKDTWHWGYCRDAVEPGSPAMGITLKVSDGDELMRARPMMVLQVLREMGILSAAELQTLQEFDRRPVENFRHLVIGEYRPAFHLPK